MTKILNSQGLCLLDDNYCGCYHMAFIIMNDDYHLNNYKVSINCMLLVSINYLYMCITCSYNELQFPGNMFGEMYKNYKLGLLSLRLPHDLHMYSAAALMWVDIATLFVLVPGTF